jgi:hypothetical protein
LEACEEDPIIFPPFLFTHLAISPYSLKKKLYVRSPLPITSPYESLVNAFCSIQLKASENPNPKFSLFSTPT